MIISLPDDPDGIMSSPWVSHGFSIKTLELRPSLDQLARWASCGARWTLGSAMVMKVMEFIGDDHRFHMMSYDFI